jgi:DNA-binding NarL/FixJ family response regulator
MRRRRVLVADDHPSVLERVSTMIGSEYEVVGAVADGLAAVDAAIVLRPDVVVLDISMPLLNGLEAAGRIVGGGVTARIVFLTVHEDPEFVEAARSAGAHGYVLKRAISAELLPAIRLALDGQYSFPQLAAQWDRSR